MSQTATLGTFDAKTRFSEVIQNVENGGQYIITKRGRPVAKIVPFKKEPGMTRAQAVRELREMRKLYRGRPGDFNVREAVEDGRR